MKLTLRPYQTGDFEALYRIDRACYEPGIAYSRRTLREYLTLPESHCLVALLDGDIAGFIIAFWQEWYAHVITIDVVESARRHGVGSALMAASGTISVSRQRRSTSMGVSSVITRSSCHVCGELMRRSHDAL